MATIPYDVAEAFLDGESRHRGAFVSHGDTIYSYGLKLASWEGDTLTGTLTLHVDLEHRIAYSVTTRRHMLALRGVLARTLKWRPRLTVSQRGY